MQKLDAEILERVRKSVAQYTRCAIVEGLLLSFCLLSALLFIYLILGNVFPYYSIVPSARRLLLLLSIALPVLSILIPLLRRPSVERHAVRLEELNPAMKDNLLAAIQLSKSRETKENYSNRMIDAVAQHTHGLLMKATLKEPGNRFRLNLLLRSSAGMLILLVLLGAFMPRHFYLPLFALAGKIPLSERTVLKAIPGNITVVKGSSVSISAVPYGRIPRRIWIHYKERDGEWMSESYSTKGGARKDFPRVVNDIHYRASIKETSTREYAIKVTYPPELTDLSLKYVYPAYTNLPPMVSTTSNGNIVALTGTQVHLTGESTQDLDKARIILGEDSLDGEVDGERFSAHLSVDVDRFYTIELIDVYGNENMDPPKFSITAIPDEYPSVRIIEPGRDIDVPNDMIIPITFRVTDDFGISKIELVSSLEGSSERAPIEENYDVNDTLLMYEWDLTELGLLPGKSVSYFVEVYDNDTYSGPKSARSETYTVSFPTLQEIYERIAEEERRSIDEITDIMPQQQEIYRRLEEIATKLRSTKEMAWEKREMIEEVIEKQKEIADEVEQLSEEIGMAVEEMKEGLMVDEEILSKMAEVARLLKEVMTDEMREALEKLRAAMESLKPEEIERAIRQLKFSQEELSERLERTLEILNRIKQERMLKQLADEASELYNQEKALRQKTGSAESEEELEALSEEQEKIRERLEQLQKELAELSRELPEVSRHLQENAEKIQPTLSKMRQTSAGLRSGMKNESLSLEDRILADLASLQESLALACSSLSSERKKEIMEAMRGAIRDLVYLSKTQESLTEEIEEAMTRAGIDTRDLAVSESVLERGVTRVADRIYEVSQKTLFISPVIGKFLGMAKANMKETEGLLEEGSVSRAGKRAGEAMDNLNKAAMLLMQSLSSCQASACASGMEECLQDMAGLASRQGALNQATQSMCPLDFPEAGLSMVERAQLARLAAEQQAIRDGVAQVAETFEERADLAGRLDDVVKEMEDITKNLERHQLDRSIVERQERILSRLLDAQRSVRRRDYTKSRQAEVGENVTDRESPQLDSPELREKIAREDMLRALGEGYPPEYENLIKEYFKALSESMVE